MPTSCCSVCSFVFFFFFYPKLNFCYGRDGGGGGAPSFSIWVRLQGDDSTFQKLNARTPFDLSLAVVCAYSVQRRVQRRDRLQSTRVSANSRERERERKVMAPERSRLMEIRWTRLAGLFFWPLHLDHFFVSLVSKDVYSVTLLLCTLCGWKSASRGCGGDQAVMTRQLLDIIVSVIFGGWPEICVCCCKDSCRSCPSFDAAQLHGSAVVTRLYAEYSVLNFGLGFGIVTTSYQFQEAGFSILCTE